MVTVATLTATNNSQEFIDMNRFSSFQKLIRVTANVLRCIHYCRNGRKPAGIELTIQEMTEAETEYIGTCQMTSYPEEIQCLTDNKKVSPLV
ncbi:hypothetical protein DPMN_031505 [Dreissena polymorpha]|uniref:Uncharacterized protein n=1 Tax=Dreissena polymorpha TaxID=45954 RepID=A0A9D4M4R9_DREPO|nr:hypothetical protein DPMN_031505 [Dreissena polymorpha]